MAKNLKIDTSFLNEEENNNDYKKNNTIDSSNYYKNTKSDNSNNSNNKKNRSKWPWLWIFSISILIALIYSWDNSSSTNPDYINSNSISESFDYYDLWEYRCSSYHYDKAMSIKPSEKLYQNKADELDKLEDEYKNYPLNEYSQSSIDNYNSKIDNYNKKLAEHEPIRLEYNRKVDIYNNYLDNNCTKKY